jgi:hypothetical protein
MKYYLADYSLRRAETGTDQQTMPLASGLTGADLEKVDSPLKLNSRYFSEIKPKVFFELQEKGKFTDVVMIHNTRAKGFLVNQVFLDFIAPLNIMDFQSYEGVLFQNEIKKEYFIFHMASTELKGLDFEKSAFKDDYDEKYGIKLKKLEDIKSYSGINLNLEKLHFKIDFPNYDMFFVPYFQVMANFFVSEKFVQEYRKLKLTGLKFTEQDVIDEW